MSGIPIYTASPINASKASGTSSQTAATGVQTIPLAPNFAPASTTAPPSTSSYSPARPGVAVPAPTGSTHRYIPLEPTPTTKVYSDGPPPPQPGSIPVPAASTNIPAPPKTGQTYHPPTQTTMRQPYPPQMSIPPPTSTFGIQPPTSSTSIATTNSSLHPAPVSVHHGVPRRSLEHPPGYQQNSYASELSSDQRRAQDATNNSSGGLGGYGGSEKSAGIDAESIWNTAKGWATTAGNKLSETEQEIWRRINKE